MLASTILTALSILSVSTTSAFAAPLVVKPRCLDETSSSSSFCRPNITRVTTIDAPFNDDPYGDTPYSPTSWHYMNGGIKLSETFRVDYTNQVTLTYIDSNHTQFRISTGNSSPYGNGTDLYIAATNSTSLSSDSFKDDNTTIFTAKCKTCSEYNSKPCQIISSSTGECATLKKNHVIGLSKCGEFDKLGNGTDSVGNQAWEL